MRGTCRKPQALLPDERVLAGISFRNGDGPMAWRKTAEREELTPVEARQGFLDRPVLLVLIASMAMVFVMFGFLLLAF